MRVWVALLTSAFVTLSATVSAQTTQSGIVQGRISASDGKALPNATVSIKQADGSYPRSVLTDARGEYRFSFLTQGIYNAEIRLVGYRPHNTDSVRVRATEVTRLDVTLQLSSTNLATVNVTAAANAIDKITTEFTSSLTAKERELLPTARDANSLIAFTPGARPDGVFGGSTGQANLYQLDGVTMNQPGTGGSFLLPNVDWLEDIRVIGLGAGAEYGNFQGGLINMVTKSGTNTRQGAIRTFYETRALGATNVNAFENGSELDNRSEINAELRGPIRKDKLYYYISGQESFLNTRVVDFRNGGGGVVAFLPTSAAEHGQKYYGKLTWLASPRDNINVSLGLDALYREHVGLNGYDAINATFKGESPAVFYQANWQRTFSTRNFLEVKFSGYVGRDNELPYAGSSQSSVQLLDIAGAPLYANASFTRRNSPSTNTITSNFDRYFNTGSLEHSLKIGGEFSLGSWREQKTRNGGLSWYTQPKANTTFNALDVSTWTVIPSIGVGTYASADTGGNVDLTADSRNGAAYIQDYIKLNSRVAINGGLRFGYWAGFITPGNGGGTRGTATFEAVSATGVDPRIGTTIDVSGHGDLVLKAHWGRYHQNLFALFFDRAPGANVFTNIAFCDWKETQRAVLPNPKKVYSPAEIASLFNCRAGRSLFNEAHAYQNYREPYMDQYTFGLEKSFGQHLKAELVYVKRQNKSVLALVDNNIDANWRPLRNVQLFDGSVAVKGPNGLPLVLPTLYVRVDSLRARLKFGVGGQVPGYTKADTLGLNASFIQDLVLKPVNEARRDFGQVQAVLTGSYPKWSFNASFAFTNLTGNLFSVNGYFNPEGQEAGPFVDPNVALNYNGKLTNFSPIDMKFRVTAQLPWQLEGGVFANVISGDYWTSTYTIPRSTNYRITDSTGTRIDLPAGLFAGISGEQIFVEPRGSRHVDVQGTVNMRLQRVFRIKKTDLLVGTELFNTFNSSAVTAVKTSLNNQSASDPSSLLGAVRLRQAPITIRLNTQIRF